MTCLVNDKIRKIQQKKKPSFSRKNHHDLQLKVQSSNSILNTFYKIFNVKQRLGSLTKTILQKGNIALMGSLTLQIFFI